MSTQTVADVFRIDHLDHVVLRVSDLERSVAWYTDVLGCKAERRVDKVGLAQMRAGRSMIDLVSMDGVIGREHGPKPGPHNMHHLCLKIDRFDEAALVRHLESKGVKPFDIAKRFGADGYGPCIYLKDPDGNWIELKGPSEPPPQGVR